MRSKVTLCVVLGLVSIAHAKDPKAYETGKVLQMESVYCGPAEIVSGETGGGGKPVQKLRCKEYALQAEQTVYHIRPRTEKHSALLPVGERAQFRLEKDKMLLRVEDLNHLDSKDRTYIVVSMTPRSDADTAQGTAGPNHLQ